MEQVMPFGQLLEAADNLSVEEQESLIDILRRRLAERRREEIAADVREAREAFNAGECRPATPDEIFEEIVS